MDDVEKILEKLAKMETSINQLKNELNDLKNEKDDSHESENFGDIAKNVFRSFNDITTITHQLRKQLRSSFRRPLRRTNYADSEGPFDFDFSFDFSNLGNFIENTVKTALSSLENLGEDFNFDFEPKKMRVKMQPGKDLRFTQEDISEGALPTIDGILHAKEILIALESKISSLETLCENTKLSKETLIQEIDSLKEKNLIIQEKFGQQRFLITKIGKKLLKELQDKTPGEQSNN